MARRNTNFSMNVYTDDFGNNWSNIPINAQVGAPKLDVIYDDRRSKAGCGGALPFTPRRLVVSFNDGRKLAYPVSAPGEIITIAQILKPSLLDNLIPGDGDDEAVCIQLIGEKWDVLTARAVGKLDYRTTPYTNIANRPIKETGNYSYTSDLSAIGTVTLRYAIEESPTDLLNCQKAGMTGAKKGRGICDSSAKYLQPRRLILKALSTFDSKEANVVRNIATSTRASLKTAASSASDCAFCFGYQGESISNLFNVVGQTIGG